MTAVYAAAAFAVSAAVIAAACRVNLCLQRERFALLDYRRRLIARLARRTVDEGYFDLRAAVGFYMRAAKAKEVDRGDGYCPCGAHTFDTPCFMPDVRDDWSRRVRPALRAVDGDVA